MSDEWDKDIPKQQWPVTVMLVCKECLRTHTIRTHSHKAAKRTAVRAGWVYTAWNDGNKTQREFWCPDCSIESEGDI